jgi:hypothetical protein
MQVVNISLQILFFVQHENDQTMQNPYLNWLFRSANNCLLIPDKPGFFCHNQGKGRLSLIAFKPILAVNTPAPMP